MKTYFEWREPRTFMQQRHEEILKREPRFSWRDVISGLVLASVFMLCWYVDKLSTDSANEPIRFWQSALMAAGSMALCIFLLPVLRRARPYPRKIKIGNKGILYFESGARKCWWYRDIRGFKIVSAESGDKTIDVLEVKNFAGRILSLGLAPEVPLDELTTVLSEQIAAAREKLTNVVMLAERQWQFIIGVVIAGCGLLLLMMTLLMHFGKTRLEKQARATRLETARTLRKLKSEQLSDQHLEIMEEVIMLSVWNEFEQTHLTRKLTLVSLSSAMLLLGLAMVFWGNSKVLYKRIARLEIYLADAVENNETKQGSKI
ncbi:MAG: hypothetical protein ACYTEL_08335 [Planctomycetota bacterium]|jgi:hypothetical protein